MYDTIKEGTCIYTFFRWYQIVFLSFFVPSNIVLNVYVYTYIGAKKNLPQIFIEYTRKTLSKFYITILDIKII